MSMDGSGGPADFAAQTGMMNTAALTLGHAAMLNAVRSFGIIVTVEPDAFLRIVSREVEPLVVKSLGGFFSTEYKYLISHKGLTFFTKSPYPLSLPTDAEVVHTKTLYIPG